MELRGKWCRNHEFSHCWRQLEELSLLRYEEVNMGIYCSSTTTRKVHVGEVDFLVQYLC